MAGGTIDQLVRVFTLQSISPGRRMVVFAVLGVLVGLTVIAFNVSRASSYLSDDAETCINCHVMNTAYATWAHSSHREVATCNDCHVPHTNIFAHYAFKAQDGARHSAIFTLRREPQVMRLTSAAVPVVNGNCIRCHERAVMDITVRQAEGETCWHCHQQVPHGDVRSLSAAPLARRPELPAAGWFTPADSAGKQMGAAESHRQQPGERPE